MAIKKQNTPTSLSELKTQSKIDKEHNLRLIKKLKTKKNQIVDSIFQNAHDTIFSCTDCLKCANCCKTTGPKFTIKDLERIAKHLNLKPGAFIEKFLKTDEDNDLVLQVLPCPFLANDNYCSIYNVRPKACKEYPHTDRVNQYQLLNLNLKNTEICPAVLDMFKLIRVKME